MRQSNFNENEWNVFMKENIKIIELINNHNKKIQMLITENSFVNNKINKIQKHFDKKTKNSDSVIQKLELKVTKLEIENKNLINKIEHLYQWAG